MKFIVFHRNGEHQTLSVITTLEAENAEEAIKLAIPMDEDLAEEVEEHCYKDKDAFEQLFQSGGEELPWEESWLCIGPGDGPFGWFSETPPRELAMSTNEIVYADFVMAISTEVFRAQANMLLG